MADRARLPGRVIAGLAAGAIITIVWQLKPQLNALIYGLVPDFAAGLVATLIVSWFTQQLEDVTAMSDSMNGR